jgi:uncharacterized protein YkwD
VDDLIDNNHSVTMACNDNIGHTSCDTYDILDLDSGIISSNSSEHDTVDDDTQAPTTNLNDGNYTLATTAENNLSCLNENAECHVHITSDD